MLIIEKFRYKKYKISIKKDLYYISFKKTTLWPYKYITNTIELFWDIEKRWIQKIPTEYKTENTEVFLWNEDIFLWFSKRKNIKNEDIKLLDIINIKSTTTQKILLDNVNLIYNFKENDKDFLFVNYFLKWVNKTQIFDLNTLNIVKNEIDNINDVKLNYFKKNNIFYKLKYIWEIYKYKLNTSFYFELEQIDEYDYDKAKIDDEFYEFFNMQFQIDIIKAILYYKNNNDIQNKNNFLQFINFVLFFIIFLFWIWFFIYLLSKWEIIIIFISIFFIYQFYKFNKKYDLKWNIKLPNQLNLENFMNINNIQKIDYKKIKDSLKNKNSSIILLISWIFVMILLFILWFSQNNIFDNISIFLYTYLWWFWTFLYIIFVITSFILLVIISYKITFYIIYFFILAFKYPFLLKDLINRIFWLSKINHKNIKNYIILKDRQYYDNFDFIYSRTWDYKKLEKSKDWSIFKKNDDVLFIKK